MATEPNFLMTNAADNFCTLCHHSLIDNSHGLDQNDLVYSESKGSHVHGGTCTYCRVCNPILEKFLTRAAQKDALEKLLRIHYGFFMANPRFWYDKDLIAADMYICVAASNLRKEINESTNR